MPKAHKIILRCARRAALSAGVRRRIFEPAGNAANAGAPGEAVVSTSTGRRAGAVRGASAAGDVDSTRGVASQGTASESDSGAGALLTGAAAGDSRGTIKTAPHPGQSTFCPAKNDAAWAVAPHCGQANWIVAIGGLTGSLSCCEPLEYCRVAVIAIPAPRMLAFVLIPRLLSIMLKLLARSVCLSLLVVGALRSNLVAGEAPSQVEAALATIKEVGREGRGHAAATKAWQLVSKSGIEQLPVVLTAIDDANPLAANWLRAAVDSIAERAVAAGDSLSAAELEPFVLDLKHSPKSRRVAYEWLCKVDETAPERLVPGFLHDPGVEFRRDAVARLLNIVKEQRGKSDDASAKKTLREALAGARDLFQVRDIAKQLGELGDSVDLQKHFGFVTAWKLIGPFDNTGESGFDVANPPETKIALDAEYQGKAGATIKWADHVTTNELGMVDFNTAIGKANGVTAYAYAVFHSEKDQTVDLRIGCICALKTWINGKLVEQRNVYHSGSSLDQYVTRVSLKKGANDILVKVLQNEQKEEWAQDWSFQLRICDATGTAILSKTP